MPVKWGRCYNYGQRNARKVSYVPVLVYVALVVMFAIAVGCVALLTWLLMSV